MVGKSWSHLLDHVFPLLDKFQNRELPDRVPIARFARSLEANPARAALVKVYTPSQFNDMEDEAGLRVSDYEGQNSILSLVPSYNKLRVAGTHPSLSQAFRDIVCGLRNARTFHVHPRSLDSWKREYTGMHQLSVTFNTSFHAGNALEVWRYETPMPDEATGKTEPGMRRASSSL
ncbi:hypothetical protein DXG03_008826 [Asterophora parasitica]|uniref:Uncharacterized protein n=1 Tax=Asterophora parasitica TaxID=117018 RepID=A0A9P7KA57_9AGAR|nr:hypothetical protein DXG03_008826 [Asterophora parasitica]